MFWNEWKINLRYIVFEKWLFKILRIAWIMIHFFYLRRCAMFWNGLNIDFDSCTIFSFEIWMTSYYKFLVNRGRTRIQKKKIMLGGSATRPGMLLNWILLTNWLSGITGRVSELGSRQVPNSQGFLGIYLTISQNCQN